MFIAANIVDGHLIRGPWGKSVRELVELLGKERVFVSVYGGPKEALHEFAQSLSCEHEIVIEDEHPVDLEKLPKVVLPTNGQQKTKRIAYLAEVRNRALAPLLDSKKYYEKVLFLNDVFFTPADAVRLLWGTNNVGPNGEAIYKAACAADFISSWKYYDTFATRDPEGYALGVPMYPWFSGEGAAISRKDVFAQKNNVRVKSCWGGMVAFDGWYFQPQHHASRSAPSPLTSSANPQITPTPPTQPLKFRSVENDTFWDASECCLIHSDILASPSPPTYLPPQSTIEDKYNTGIYLNPYIRVSYSASTHAWLPFTKRFERLFAPIQIIFANPIGHMPRPNPRRSEREGEIIHDRRWVRLNPLSSSNQSSSKEHPHEIGSEDGTWQGDHNGMIGKRSNEKHTTQRPASYWENEGFYEDYERLATRDGYCGTRQLTVMKDRSRGTGDDGGLWDKLVDEVPPLER